ncbi:hypothetical protein LEP1GSC145_1192 [Leptospira interrogans serovar Djasiman str. LT1649]|nr:hypothetical protein LEP1GSC148_2751 [Leptospira interrogans serovar Canicola str. LT1962]EMM92854.1 hypothetical protein LEP1GSC145_1192 [Leptospira interrogans serovar Djasiman str. LT1649]
MIVLFVPKNPEKARRKNLSYNKNSDEPFETIKRPEKEFMLVKMVKVSKEFTQTTWQMQTEDWSIPTEPFWKENLKTVF